MLLYLKLALYNIKMKGKIHVNNIFLYLEHHKIANKNHHDRSRESADEREKFYILVPLIVLYFQHFKQEPPCFNFALCPTNYAAISVLSSLLFKVRPRLRIWNTINNYT